MIFGVSEETFICSGCKVSDPSEGQLEYIYTKYKEKPYQSYEYETSNIEEFTRLHIFDGYVSGTFFNGLTGEKYEASMREDTFETSSYASFIRNTKVVEYTNTYYFVNLQEILGWDRLGKVSDENNAYLLYYGDTLLSSEYYASIVYNSSEYPYFYIHGTQIGDDILSLSIFGLTTPYTNDYFINKFNEGGVYAYSILVNHQLNRTYAENYASFNEIINSLY